MVFAELVNPQIIFNGMVLGLVYGLLAMSIVLIYRSTKVINFAVGNMGLVGVGLLVICDVNYGFPYWLSLLIALVVGTLYGAVVELVVIRRLFRAPRVIVLVATIGIAELSLAIMSTYPGLVGSGARFPQAIGSEWSVGPVLIKGPELVVLIVVPVIALALGLFLNRTLFGWTVRASSNDPDLARLSGISPKLVSTFVWAVGGLLATISMVMVGSLTGSVSSLESLGPTTLLRALIAAVVARLTNFRTALIVGVAIGIGEQILRFNFIDQPGLADLLLLIVVLIAVWVQSRGSGGEESPYSFVPRTMPMPDRLRSRFWVRHLGRFAMLAMLAVAIVLPLVVTQPSRQILYATILAFAICALSLTVLTGWAGQLSLGQMAFAGVGAFTAAALSRGMVVDWQVGGARLIGFELYELPFAASAVIGALVTTLLSVVVGAGALRVKGLLLAVTTFAFAITATSWVSRLDVFTGGSTGTVSFPRGDLFGLDLSDQRNYYYVVLAVLVVVVAAVGRLRRSGVGRVTVAVRDNPDSAASYTVRSGAAKLRAFALAGFIAGLGGALLGGALRQVPTGPTSFGVAMSLTLVAMIVIGGMGSSSGAIIGAVWIVGLPALFPDNELVPLLSSSLGLLALLLYFPGGLVQVVYNVRTALYRWLEQKLPPVEKSGATPPAVVGRTVRRDTAPGLALSTTGVCVNFGGLMANDHISVEVRSGEIVGLIGGNGAGKSTFMNAVSGFTPCRGKVELLGEPVTDWSPARRARAGLGRTFQNATLFPELTVRETVEVALEARGRSGLIATTTMWPPATRLERSKRSEAADLIDFLGLGRYADKPIVELSTGTRRIIELAGLLALDARLLCLDEPTAGVAEREAEAMGPLLVEVRRQLGASMLIIEHDMPLIMAMSDRIYCLELGRVIAEGEPRQVRDDPAVIASYLGTDERTIQRSGTVPA